jgi:hypothetical protein
VRDVPCGDVFSPPHWVINWGQVHATAHRSPCAHGHPAGDRPDRDRLHTPSWCQAQAEIIGRLFSERTRHSLYWVQLRSICAVGCGRLTATTSRTPLHTTTAAGALIAAG